MIKTISKFIGGFITGSIVAFILAYTFGYFMQSMNISLYASESEQQRNFNIFIIFTLALAIMSGYIATKIGNKTNN
jgi:CDP-diglyceride synthetase